MYRCIDHITLTETYIPTFQSLHSHFNNVEQALTVCLTLYIRNSVKSDNNLFDTVDLPG